jgi:hypothetical protein
MAQRQRPLCLRPLQERGGGAVGPAAGEGCSWGSTVSLSLTRLQWLQEHQWSAMGLCVRCYRSGSRTS